MTMDNKQSPKYVLQPLVGLTVVKFGMTQAQIAKVLGKPRDVDDDDVLEMISEKRDGMAFEYWYEDKKKLGAVQFLKGTSVFYGDVDLMNTKDVTDLLKKQDPKSNDYAGYTNFPKLGLTLGGFGKRRIPEGKLIIAWGPMKANIYAKFGSV
jgi:hypothetical protein